MKLPGREHVCPILRHREGWEVKSQIPLTISKALESPEPPLLPPKPLGPGPDHLPPQHSRTQKFTSVVSPVFSVPDTRKPSSRKWGHRAGMGVQGIGSPGTNLEEEQPSA